MHSQSLISKAASAPRPSEVMSWGWRLHALRQLASGLAHLHAHRVVHGDVK